MLYNLHTGKLKFEDFPGLQTFSKKFNVLDFWNKWSKICRRIFCQKLKSEEFQRKSEKWKNVGKYVATIYQMTKVHSFDNISPKRVILVQNQNKFGC